MSCVSLHILPCLRWTIIRHYTLICADTNTPFPIKDGYSDIHKIHKYENICKDQCNSVPLWSRNHSPPKLDWIQRYYTLPELRWFQVSSPPQQSDLLTQQINDIRAEAQRLRFWVVTLVGLPLSCYQELFEVPSNIIYHHWCPANVREIAEVSCRRSTSSLQVLVYWMRLGSIYHELREQRKFWRIVTAWTNIFKTHRDLGIASRLLIVELSTRECENHKVFTNKLLYKLIQLNVVGGRHTSEWGYIEC